MIRFSRATGAILFFGAAALTLAAPTISHAEESVAARDVTALSAVTAPAEHRAAVRTRDHSVKTYSSFAPDEPFSCAWAAEAGVRGVYIRWYAPPDSVILVQTGENGEEISREPLPTPLYNDFYQLNEAARGLTIASGTGMQIAELTLYSAGDLPGGVYDWQPPVEKADLLVISAHCDDELLFFGGTIPYYAEERGLSVQVAYLANGDRARVEEALAGLWRCGIRNAPVFLPLPDVYTDTLEKALLRWDEQTTLDALVTLIRWFRPEVIVTHDRNGEYGHGAHRAAAYCVEKAVPLAADATRFPDSAAAYGAWRVRKLYLHLLKENPATMDWNRPLAAFGGKTALEVANEAYHLHVSQLEYHPNVYGAGEFSSAEYGLAYSTVGVDMAKNDFFEHIDQDRLGDDRASAPEPTASIPTAATPAATPAAASTEKKEETTQNAGLPILLIAGASGFIAAFAAALAIIVIHKNRTGK